MKSRLWKFIIFQFLFITAPIKTQSYLEANDKFELGINEENIIDADYDLLKTKLLTGNWWGAREVLSENGLEFGFTYVGESISNLYGGIEKEIVYLDNIDITMNIDLEKTLGWDGAALSVYVLGNNGGIPSEYVGAVQGISNIAAHNTWKFYELWIEQYLFNEKLTLLFGLYDLNSEFDTREASAVFINPSHGIGPELSQTGEAGPSIFPTTSLALRAKLMLSEKTYLQSAIFDGIPGDPDNPNGTQILLDGNDGLLIASEIGYYENGEALEEGYGKYSIGGWYFTSLFDDIADVNQQGDPVLRNNNFGAYLSAEKFLFAENEDKAKGLAAFVRVGFANSDINMLHYYWGAGITYTGIFSSGNDDIIGLAIATAHSSSKYRLFVDPNAASNEINIELTYSAQFLPWLRIQPDFQYVINPMDCITNKSALVFGTRFEINF